jgi:hypothetical protein
MSVSQIVNFRHWTFDIGLSTLEIKTQKDD